MKNITIAVGALVIFMAVSAWFGYKAGLSEGKDKANAACYVCAPACKPAIPISEE